MGSTHERVSSIKELIHTSSQIKIEIDRKKN